MAIPPPHAFINVREARWLRPGRLELQFRHPPPLAGLSPFFVQIFRDGPAEADGYAPLALGLFEHRESHGEASCAGEPKDHCLWVDIADVLPDTAIQRGRITFNDAALYGHHRLLDPFSLELALQSSLALVASAGNVDTAAAMQTVEQLLARALPEGENATWGWLPLPRPGWAQDWRRLSANGVIDIDAGGLRQNRILGLIRLVPAAGRLELHRYSYYGDDDRIDLYPDPAWWLEALACLWPAR